MRPFPLRFERRLASPRWLPLVVPLISGLVATLASAVILAATGHDPISTFSEMLDAAFTSAGAFSATLSSATPLLFTGLTAAVAFRMRVWNIGGEGQLMVGAICAAAVGFAVGSQGLAVALPTMVLAGMAGAMLWAAVPGLLRTYLRTNEILTTLMFNYLAAILLVYLIFESHSYVRDLSPAAAGFPRSKELDQAAYWPAVNIESLSLPLGFLIGLGIAVGLQILFARTWYGFQLRVIAESPAAGRFAGMRTRSAFMVVMLLSGALAGLGGISQVGDFSHQLEPTGLTLSQLGYTGIVVAALARFNPLGVILAAVLVGALTNAGFKIQGPDFPQGLVGTMVGIILFCVLGGEVLSRYRIGLVHGHEKAGQTELLTASEGGRYDVVSDHAVEHER